MTKRLIVGLTGTFGSGKTTAANLFRKAGAQVIHSDELAHEIYRPDAKELKKIKLLFNVKGPVSRKQIAKEVFSDPEKRRALEQVAHPYVKRRILQEIKKAKREIIILEVPLLFETKLDRMCDVTVAVAAGKANVLKRRAKPGLSRAEIKLRLAAQMPEAEKLRKADFIINNKRSIKQLAQEIEKVRRKLIVLVKSKNKH